MRAVVDTNVVAYYVLGTPQFARESERFLGAADDLFAPALWEAEFANVVWMAVRTGVLPVKESAAKLSLAIRLGVNAVSVRTLWGAALLRSVESGIAVYDTLFVELAHRERAPLATFDRKLLRAFPDLACRPGDIAA